MRCGQHLLLHPPPGGSGGKVGLLERSPSGRSPNVHRTKSIDIGEITFTREQMGAPRVAAVVGPGAGRLSRAALPPHGSGL